MVGGVSRGGVVDLDAVGADTAQDLWHLPQFPEGTWLVLPFF